LPSRSYYSDPYDHAGGTLSHGAGTFWLASLWRWVVRRPKDAIALCLAVGASGTIIVNALFLQSGPHPAPIFSAVAGPAAPAATVARTMKSSRLPQDPIAEILQPAERVMAMQRALSEFGYGQIKVDGVMGPETTAAIEKFEREHNLPVTGRFSEPLARELSALTSKPI
jgi:Putative peptidoglycan binding domain